jgi:hypothetical protein
VLIAIGERPWVFLLARRNLPYLPHIVHPHQIIEIEGEVDFAL